MVPTRLLGNDSYDGAMAKLDELRAEFTAWKTVSRGADFPKENPAALRLAGYPYAQILYITAGVLILVLSFLERPAESVIALLVVAAGVPAYFIFKKTGKNAKKISE